MNDRFNGGRIPSDDQARLRVLESLLKTAASDDDIRGENAINDIITIITKMGNPELFRPLVERMLNRLDRPGLPYLLYSRVLGRPDPEGKTTPARQRVMDILEAIIKERTRRAKEQKK